MIFSLHQKQQKWSDPASHLRGTIYCQITARHEVSPLGQASDLNFPWKPRKSRTY
ncbi:hypothetical protein H1P_610030 [Hyella patelloides LEGE 07179]|uniref:Uncharacterized protein n=1 Tax=Hyella patelloides LEGE 07179 TaxID=945734 RepID=A0A563W193_9CYAN|nr:hypothetical protein H1P_610030 [Hyella patelloides LEGE 07179]